MAMVSSATENSGKLLGRKPIWDKIVTKLSRRDWTKRPRIREEMGSKKKGENKAGVSLRFQVAR